MKAIILAAGMGRRMGNLTQDCPKCLLSFNSSTLLERQIEICNQFNIKEIIIVGGYLHKQIRQIYDNVLVNKEYRNTHSTYSLRIALESIKEPDDLIVIDGDMIFEPQVIRYLKNTLIKEPMVIVCKVADTRQENGTKVVIHNNQVQTIGRNLAPSWPWKIYSGLMGISCAYFNLAKDEIKKDMYKPYEIGRYLNVLCNTIKIYPLILNPRKAIKTKQRIDIETGRSRHLISINKRQGIVTKEAQELDDNITLAAEIQWLQKARKHSAHHFPKILDFDLTASKIYYKMPFYNYPLFLDLLMNNAISVNKSVDIMKKIIKFCFDTIYSQDIQQPYGDFTEITHLQRVQKRIKEVSSAFPALQSIINTKKLIINGVRCFNWSVFLDKLVNSRCLISRLQPPYLSRIHGDLQLKNILISPKLNDFILIDPKGITVSDPIYDLGKLWQSLEAGYDLYQHEDFYLKWDGESNIFDFGLKEPSTLNRFNLVCERLKKVLNQEAFIKKDPEWSLRLEFTEIMHLGAVLPWTLKEGFCEERIICIYLLGVLKANKFWNQIQASCKRRDKVAQWVNINTIEDYIYAKKLFIKRLK